MGEFDEMVAEHESAMRVLAGVYRRSSSDEIVRTMLERHPAEADFTYNLRNWFLGEIKYFAAQSALATWWMGKCKFGSANYNRYSKMSGDQELLADYYCLKLMEMFPRPTAQRPLEERV